jgi:mono/diheme cytochrome c family protein
MNYWKIVVLFVLLIATVFTVSSCVVRKSEPLTGEKFTRQKESVASGEKLYMEHCQKCHPMGEGGLGPSINSNPAPRFVKRFQMRHGLGVMPSFNKEELSKQDLKDISDYLKAWKHYD